MFALAIRYYTQYNQSKPNSSINKNLKPRGYLILNIFTQEVPYSLSLLSFYNHSS